MWNATEFDYLPQDFLTNPYPYYSRLRAEDPVHLSSRGVWILTRYDDVTSVLRDQRFGRRGFQKFLRGASSRSRDNGPASMLFQDAANHTRLRALVGKVFTYSVIQSVRPHIQQVVDDLLDEARDAQAIELISDFAFPLPVHVIAEVLGLPASDRDLFYKWSLDLVEGMEARPIAPEFQRAPEAREAIADYFRSAIAGRRQNPRDDLLTGLIAAEKDGERLNEFELLDICGLLFVAGHETTVNLIGNGMLALLIDADERRRLRENPELLPSAVEELLRYDSPVQRTGRIAETTVKIGCKTIPKGAVVSALLGAANRDPDRFPEPDRLDVGRRDNRHLAFGLGDHFCIGAALARLEGHIAIGTILRRLPDLELAGSATWRHSTETRGLRSLPAVF